MSEEQYETGNNDNDHFMPNDEASLSESAWAHGTVRGDAADDIDSAFLNSLGITSTAFRVDHSGGLSGTTGERRGGMPWLKGFRARDTYHPQMNSSLDPTWYSRWPVTFEVFIILGISVLTIFSAAIVSLLLAVFVSIGVMCVASLLVGLAMVSDEKDKQRAMMEIEGLEERSRLGEHEDYYGSEDDGDYWYWSSDRD